jgi:hypothetical protein
LESWPAFAIHLSHPDNPTSDNNPILPYTCATSLLIPANASTLDAQTYFWICSKLLRIRQILYDWREKEKNYLWQNWFVMGICLPQTLANERLQLHSSQDCAFVALAT